MVNPAEILCRSSPAPEKSDVFTVAEHPVSCLAGEFHENACRYQPCDQVVRGRETRFCTLCYVVYNRWGVTHCIKADAATQTPVATDGVG